MKSIADDRHETKYPRTLSQDSILDLRAFYSHETRYPGIYLVTISLEKKYHDVYVGKQLS